MFKTNYIKIGVLNLSSSLDKIDKNIIDLFRRNPEITHSEIADKVGRSQPAIGKRIKKLEKKGLLSYQVGSNVKEFDFIFVKVEIRSKDPEKVLDIAEKCPFMPIAFKLTGENNINIIAYGYNLKFVSDLLTYHFKEEKHVKSMKFEIILDINEDLVLPIDLNIQKCEFFERIKKN
ncbi:MAG: Lrp/AsnC family transcriptional regulator [Promethearchaeota archaeon]|nr:MAG: Lrp/AsnC family transcriptional regulator [Candidatus Lokiarchaeota archaeon]